MKQELEVIKQNVINCTKCDLCKTRTNSVPGKGNFQSDVIFVGEAPGRNEDKNGEPFIGIAGKKLSIALDEAGISRESVYITNVVKCRPPNNRDPQDDEIEKCSAFLERQISIIKPSVIISLGRVSSQRLLGTEAPISRLRGQFFVYNGIPVMPTFHPAYLMRNPKAKWDTWSDAKKVLEKLKS